MLVFTLLALFKFTCSSSHFYSSHFSTYKCAPLDVNTFEYIKTAKIMTVLQTGVL